MGSYERVQPGSVSASQSLETEHAHDFCGAFVDKEGKPLQNLTPRAYIRVWREVAIYKCKQLRANKQVLEDAPSGSDPFSRSSTRMRQAVRATAIQLYKQWRHIPSSCVHVVTGPDDTFTTVMPRTLFWFAPSPADPQKKEWQALPIEKLRTTKEEAELISKMAVERNVGVLKTLWAEAGILVKSLGRRRVVFHAKQWRRYRYDRVAVLDKDTSATFWRSSANRFRVCPCLPFGLGGRCEHEQAVAGIEEDESCLETPGANGKPQGAQPKFGARGVSSKVALRLTKKKKG